MSIESRAGGTGHGCLGYQGELWKHGGKQLEEAQRKESTKGSRSGIAGLRMIMGEVKAQRSFRVIQVTNSTS